MDFTCDICITIPCNYTRNFPLHWTCKWILLLALTVTMFNKTWNICSCSILPFYHTILKKSVADWKLTNNNETKWENTSFFLLVYITTSLTCNKTSVTVHEVYVNHVHTLGFGNLWQYSWPSWSLCSYGGLEATLVCWSMILHLVNLIL